MSDTPRTDRAVVLGQTLPEGHPYAGMREDWVTATFARTLERELAAKQVTSDWPSERIGQLERALVSVMGLFDPYGRGRLNEPQSRVIDVLDRARDVLDATEPPTNRGGFTDVDAFDATMRADFEREVYRRVDAEDAAADGHARWTASEIATVREEAAKLAEELGITKPQPGGNGQ